MRFAGRPVQEVGQRRVEVDLDQDRDRQQRDDERLRDDLLALEAEEQHQGRQQRDERHRLEPVEQSLERGRPAAGEHAGAG